MDVFQLERVVFSYFDGLLRYFEFSGRSSRRQYWLFQLFYGIVTGIALAADIFGVGWQGNGTQPGPFLAFALIFHIIPLITVTVRRLHDTGRSGWWLLISFVPLGGLLILVWTCFGSEPGSNKYGDDPRNPGTPAPRPRRSRTAAGPGFDASAGRAARSTDYAQDVVARLDARRDSSTAAASGRFMA